MSVNSLVIELHTKFLCVALALPYLFDVNHERKWAGAAVV